MTVVRTRFAPSPTGYLHIGGVRTALFSWLFARHHAGTFILRVEDTDRERSTPEAVQVILDGMQWLDLDCDEGPFYQSRRMDRYGVVLKQMLDLRKAYHCYCSKEELDAMRAEAMARGGKPRYNGRCRDRLDPPPKGVQPVVRFRNPQDGEVVIDDLIQGRVVYRNAELDDLIIARSDGSPTYNFTVVVDDYDMAITHVIRGDDHLNNTPRQINIFQALGKEAPRYGHIPLILGPDGKKLSKRHGTVSVLQYRDDGFLPEALLNYLVRLGWSHGDQEIFTRDEMIALFDVADVNKSAAALNPDKILWLNQHYLKTADDSRLGGLLAARLKAAGVDPGNGPDPALVAAVQKERTRTLVDMTGQSLCFYREIHAYDPTVAEKQLNVAIQPALISLLALLAGLPDWTDAALHQALETVAAETGLKLGKLAQPVRVAVTGGTVSPSIDKTLRLLGREQSMARLERAVEYIARRAGP
ncbi:MAG: glutamate--tRNA ligase [Gammaproteobacteria bacterium RIFCSPLOWO2_02_FULL_61_13]|nr:MAG: glutamate--tRNA ligase [Gammaproteobacteria bacterium RIFCSPLOWO2_02_FULL_61_13]